MNLPHEHSQKKRRCGPVNRNLGRELPEGLGCGLSIPLSRISTDITRVRSLPSVPFFPFERRVVGGVLGDPRNLKASRSPSQSSIDHMATTRWLNTLHTEKPQGSQSLPELTDSALVTKPNSRRALEIVTAMEYVVCYHTFQAVFIRFAPTFVVEAHATGLLRYTWLTS